ncbi:hypothetical protein CC99x_009950 [Candidatus Berkiella cookevillensis]|uniref:Glycosyltransferase RgtA/B/C/D-like domain-containing protein n=1 Tax=Candidatus Berkiella cookevillensis TaxID=437022 RepID=A0A0Q9YBV8_9GAMM|nr:hypothetical protein [Candidatus Berkiella cookevillensis]MCS5709227.1 hypothetical protein [Candidatus Berkiella cookevillensis]
MFVVYCLILAICVYFAPALALFPKLALHPRLFVLTPMISALIVYLLVSFFLILGFYEQSTVIMASVILCSIAVFRVRRNFQTVQHYWSKSACKLYFFHAVVLLPFFIKLATHGFDRGDEIYSWNFWAIQHYLSIPIDISHTGAPYPQLLPKLLSYCYQLLGDLSLQLPVKSLLILFPFMMLNAIGLLLKSYRTPNIILYSAGLVFLLFVCNLSQFFDDGYADPLMTSGVILSVICYWRYHHWCQRINRISKGYKSEKIALSYLLFAVLAAIAAFLSKQPGLQWVAILSVFIVHGLLFSKPRTAYFKCALMGLLVLLLGAAWLWLSTEGHNFEENKGVIWLSKGNRNLFSQLASSAYTYLIAQPTLLVLFVLAYLSCKQHSLLKVIYGLFLVPGILLWFIFGAYQLRLGQHLMVLAWFVIVASQFKAFYFFNFEYHLASLSTKIMQYRRQVTLCLVMISVSISALLWYKVCYIEQKGVSLYDGDRIRLSRYFGQDADWIYQNIYKNQSVLLWVPSRYIYGLFYPHTKLATPNYRLNIQYDMQALLDELEEKQPDYVIDVDDAIMDGPAVTYLRTAIAQCPTCFEVVAKAPNRYHFITYRVHHERLKAARIESIANVSIDS